ncbi:MAG: hypothetical protein H6568_10860 [Lewinellaceae bacterium]|nr:hypothetical protein [Saprospiraceae bacterium]MCB9313256.1 hypothetical protein [Lewinellaceae bacterium]HRW76309.1 hypothetical protein [Saprospiraceae bacterium]
MRLLPLLTFSSVVFLTACTFTIPTTTGGSAGGSNPNNSGAGLEEKQRTGPTDKIAAELGLSADQLTRYNRIISDNQSKMAGIQANKSLSTEAKRTQLEQLEQQKHTSIRAILTPQQVTRYNQLVQEGSKRDPVVIPGRK